MNKEFLEEHKLDLIDVENNKIKIKNIDKALTIEQAEEIAFELLNQIQFIKNNIENKK